MAKKKVAPKKAVKEKLDPNLEAEYFEEVTYHCPKRGLVTQKVKVKRLKPKDGKDTSTIGTSDDLIEAIDKDDSINIYTEEELERSGSDDID